MRIRVLTVMIVLLTSACGSSEPSISAGDLFREYTQSTDVTNDRFASSGSSEDRLANFAAYYSVDQLQAVLLRTFACSEAAPANPEPSNRCHLSFDVSKAAEDAGAKDDPLGRSIVVKHADGSLELVTLYVAQGSGDRNVLIDADGQTYTGLEDFRANNDLLDADDTMLTLRDITSVPGEGEVVAVTGATPSTWQWWLLGGMVVVALFGAGIIVIRRRANARSAALPV